MTPASAIAIRTGCIIALRRRLTVSVMAGRMMRPPFSVIVEVLLRRGRMREHGRNAHASASPLRSSLVDMLVRLLLSSIDVTGRCHLNMSSVRRLVCCVGLAVAVFGIVPLPGMFASHLGDVFESELKDLSGLACGR